MARGDDVVVVVVVVSAWLTGFVIDTPATICGPAMTAYDLLRAL
jgi:hypothetical protein